MQTQELSIESSSGIDIDIVGLIFGSKKNGGVGTYTSDIKDFCNNIGIKTRHIANEDLRPVRYGIIHHFSEALSWFITMKDAQRRINKMRLSDKVLCMDCIASQAIPNSVAIIHGMLTPSLENITKNSAFTRRLKMSLKEKYGIDLFSKRGSIFLRLIKELEISGFQSARHLIVTNRQVGEYIKKVSNRNYEHIPNPINMDRFKITDKVVCKSMLGLPLNKKCILFACTSHEKYKDKFPEWRSELTNQGFYVSNLDFSIEYSKMPYVYNAFDLTVMPMRIEGIGRFTLESMACGTPYLSNASPIGYHCEDIEKLVQTIKSFDFNIDRESLREQVEPYSRDIIIPRLLQRLNKN